MIVIADSSVLINLAKVGLFDVLKSLYGEVTVSPTVFAEVTETGVGKSGAREVREASWIRVLQVKDADKVALLLSDLDRGEAESVVLAMEQKADLVLVDELKARNKLRLLGINIKGTLGVLLFAYERQLIHNVPKVMDELIGEGSWIDQSLYDKVRELAERIKKP